MNQPTTQVPETALQAQIRTILERAHAQFHEAEARWLEAEQVHEAEAQALPSYATARRLFNVREQARLNLNRALQESDRVNGTAYAPREGAEVAA